MHKLEILQMQPADWQNDRAVMRQLCRLGVPTVLQNGIIAIGGFVVQGYAAYFCYAQGFRQ
jgi:Na+-driven multidrug efflux pump